MIDGEIANSLSSLKPIGLNEIETVKLMNRVETKYVFSVRKLDDLINLMNGSYKVLEIENLRTFPYMTTYLDTPGYLFFNQHVRGEYERHKIRYRKYESSGTSYLEIKKKTNKRRTIKQRIKNNLTSGYFDEPATNFIREYLPVNLMLLKPVLINHFTRATLIGLESKERITIDFNISFSDLAGSSQVAMPYLAIAELKNESYSMSSPFISLIKHLNIYPTGFSKYCIGNAILNNMLRINMIKPKLLLLNKIENEYDISYNS